MFATEEEEPPDDDRTGVPDPAAAPPAPVAAGVLVLEDDDRDRGGKACSSSPRWNPGLSGAGVGSYLCRYRLHARTSPANARLLHFLWMSGVEGW